MNRVILACGLAAAFLLSPVRASAQQSPPAPEIQQPAAAPPASADRPGSTASAAQGGNPLARLLLLPDISGTFSGALSYQDFVTDEANAPRAGPFGTANKLNPIFEEFELGLQAVVDPYARADVFISFTPEEVDVEEAYITALTLPYGLSARGGKLFSPFGRINQQHPHAWDFVDRPLAHARLLGPEALGGAGASVAWLAPLPWYAELHLAYQAVRPGLDEEAEDGRAGIGRIVQYFDLSPETTLGAGASGALVQEPGAEAGWRDLAGGDVYLKIRPGGGRAFVAFQGEVLWSRLRDVPDAADDSEWGAYAQAVWRRSPYWAYGVRYDRAPGIADGVLSGAEHRVSALVSWLPSEFQRFRLQGGWTRLPGEKNGWEGIFSIEFGMGAHGAHPF
jgi:hypothetical protein